MYLPRMGKLIFNYIQSGTAADELHPDLAQHESLDNKKRARRPVLYIVVVVTADRWWSRSFSQRHAFAAEPAEDDAYRSLRPAP